MAQRTTLEEEQRIAVVCGRLRAMRLDAGLSLRALGERIGVSGQQVYVYESGYNAPTLTTLWRYTRALGRSMHEAFPEDW